MGQKKLFRFEAIKAFSNVLQYPENMPGKWNNFFQNSNPITLELACGKGEYTVELANMYTNRNFIGVDLKGNRLYIGAKKCLEQHIVNAAFLRTQIGKLDLYFDRGEVSDIWLTFPDPQLRKSKARKRLTHPRFLRLYQQVLTPGGRIHLKTDSPELYHFTKSVIGLYQLNLHRDEENIYANAQISPELRIRTYYESLDISKSSKVHYLSFSLPSHELPDLDSELQDRTNNHEERTD